jgi:GNAT superfamily N-acetyltransferase
MLTEVDAVWDKFIAQVKSSQPELLAARALSLGKFAIGEAARGIGLGEAVIESAIVPYAVDNGFDCIRLDYPKNASNDYLAAYYRRHQFTPKGTIEVPLGGTNNPDNRMITMELAQRNLDLR